jgi:hypothetical protein
MKCAKVMNFTIVVFSMFVVGSSFGSKNETQPSPSVFVAEPVYEFGQVVDGTKITHDYVIQNKGSARLTIETIITGSGCTAVSFTRYIPPGGEGKISIEADTSGYGGEKFKGNISVVTNDKKRQRLTLTITGDVEKIVTITPKRVLLWGPVDEETKATVRIIPEKKYPFKIVETKAKSGKNINYKMLEIKGPNGIEYILTIENLKKTEAQYRDSIFLETTSEIRPVIKIPVFANISAAHQHKKNKTPGH